MSDRASDSSPEAARWRRDMWVSCRKATAKAATNRQLLPVAVRDTMRCTTCWPAASCMHLRTRTLRLSRRCSVVFASY